jgi:tRNA pseudouridine38-40 synthase
MRTPPFCARRSNGTARAKRQIMRKESGIVHNWKLTIEYDGGRYSGWQEQINARTIQGELKRAASAFLQTEVDLQGAGRTDAGVHALAQVASLRAKLKYAPSPAELAAALNGLLPADIAILGAERADPRFHARHDAKSRAYRYQISTRKTAFAKRYVWWVKEPLDVPAMARAARSLEGRHDFVNFRAQDPARPTESTLVVVDSARIETEASLILFRIEASHFLWRMVRRLAGTLVKLGKGEITEADFAALLAAKKRNDLDVAAWTAPSSGLLLESVRYK